MQHKYQNHFYDPIRIEIAASQIQHEFRKLFSSVDQDQWEKIDKDISGWFGGEEFELEEAHDFWNFFYGVVRGLKLKSLLFWVTAENVLWEKREVSLQDVIMTWDYPNFGFMGKAPFPVAKLMEKINKTEMQKFKQEMVADEDKRSAKFTPRDQFPIVLLHDPKGKILNKYSGYYILDGNRRTTRAVVNDFPKILAYVGKFKNDYDIRPENFWINTGIFRDLIFFANYYQKSKDTLGFKVVRDFYQLLLRDFDIARFATFDKSFKDFERNELLLRELFIEDLRCN